MLRGRNSCMSRKMRIGCGKEKKKNAIRNLKRDDKRS